MSGSPAANKQMQRARTNHEFVLGYAHQRVADLRRYRSWFQDTKVGRRLAMLTVEWRFVVAALPLKLSL